MANNQTLPPAGGCKDSDGGKFGPLSVNTESLHGFGLSSNYSELQPIGFGVHGLVVSALDQEKHCRVAAKKIKIESQISCRYALREVRILCQMKHDNIVRVLDVLLDQSAQATSKRTNNTESSSDHTLPTTLPNPFQLYIISELLDTNLHVLITQKLLDAEHVTLITYQILRGLHYLRSANVVHRDLKPSNLFINCDTLLLKIGDFGLARIIDPNYSHSGHLTADLGTYWYRAPELMLSPQSYTPAVDLWGAGCVVAEMLLGKPIFTGANDVDQLRHIIDAVELNERDWSAVLHVVPNRMLHQHPLTPQRPLSHRLNDVDPLVVDLLEKLLVFDPLQRMTPAEALAHPYLQIYAKPEREPIAAESFGIEAEVDDLPIEQLKKLIHQEKNRKRGRRGICNPIPSPVDRPKVSSATLSLKLASDRSQRNVPTSPTFDNIVHEQRRNRRNKISASVDLSFISLPSTDKQEKQIQSAAVPQKAVYSTRNYPTKHSAIPSPWQWPVGNNETHSQDVPTASALTQAGTFGDSCAVSTSMNNDMLKSKTCSDTSSTRVNISQPSVPPGFTAHPATNVYSRKTDIEDARTHRRVRSRRRALACSQDEVMDFMQFDPDDDMGHHNTDHLMFGKIETYEEKTQSCIDRELNKKNRTASLDSSHTTTQMYGHKAEIPIKRSAVPGKETTSSLSPWKTNTSSALRRRIPGAIVKVEAPITSSISGDSLRKRSTEVGLRVVRSPKPQRKSGSVESHSSGTAKDRRYSYTQVEGSPPITSTERKFSVSCLDKSQPSSRCHSWDERQRSVNTSLFNQPMGVAKCSRPKSISPLLLARTQAIEGRCNGSQLLTKPIQTKTTHEVKEVIGKANQPQTSSNFAFDDEQILFCSKAETHKNKVHPDDIPERPRSVISTLTIPGLSPMMDIEHPQNRRVSQTKLAVDENPMNKDIIKQSNQGESCPSVEGPRCSSRLSIDLSFVNKEQQKTEEEEKDSVEVSDRKQQEDWEIESQSSQKSEWTLGEILGVPEDEVTEGDKSHQQQEEIVLSDNEDASASMQRPSDTETFVTDDSQERKVCRTKLDLIPYHVLTPDIMQLPRALTTYVKDASVSEVTPNKNTKRVNTNNSSKLQEQSLDSKRKQFTAQYFMGTSRTSARNASTQELQNREPSTSLREKGKDHIHCLAVHGVGDPTSKFGLHKSEDDLISPRSHSPRDVIGARAITSCDVSDLPGFKQCVKENLSTLNVSIPKDFPEKRRLIKAHSTESVCSEGESSSSQKVQDSTVINQSSEDLIQFSPVGGSKAEEPPCQESQTLMHQQQQEEIQGPYPDCNHCLYQGDCKGPTCGNPMRHDSAPKPDVLSLQQPLIPQRIIIQQRKAIPLGEPEAHRRARAARRAGVRSSLDELCYSKDVFNERQKLMGGGQQRDCDSSTGDGFIQYPWRKTRPKSAKN